MADEDQEALLADEDQEALLADEDQEALLAAEDQEALLADEEQEALLAAEEQEALLAAPLSPVEEAIDARFEADLAARWPRATPPLLQIVMKAVVDNFDFFHPQENFSELPRVLLKMMYEDLMEKNRRTPDILSIFIGKVNELFLPILSWSVDDIEGIIRLLETNQDCLTSLRTVTIFNAFQYDLTADQYRRILLSQPNLRKLSADSLRALRNLPECAPNLEKFHIVTRCVVLSDSDVHIVSSLRDLTHLTIDCNYGTTTCMSTQNLVTILENLPYLQEFKTVNFEEALLLFADRHKFSRQLALTSLYSSRYVTINEPPFFNSYRIVEPYTADQINTMIDILPKLKNIKFHPRAINKKIVCEIKNLSNFNLTVHSFRNIPDRHANDFPLPSSKSEFSNFFINFGVKLTELKLDVSFDATRSNRHPLVDLSEIGKFCPDIRDISLHESTVYDKCNFNMEPHFFSKLKDFIIYNKEISGKSYSMLTSALTHILTRPSLESFKFKMSTPIPPIVYHEVFLQARLNSEVFSSLTHLSLCCPHEEPDEEPTNANIARNVEQIMEFTCLAPKLKVFKHWMRHDEEVLLIFKRFVRRHLLRVNE